MGFVTVDLDAPTLLRIVRSWNNLEALGGTVRGRVSSSGRGVHLRADGIDADGVAERERRIAGDDAKRIALDLERDYRPPQVLFDSKGQERATGWVDCPDSLIRMYRRTTGFTF